MLDDPRAIGRHHLHDGSAGSNRAQEAREQIADLFARHGGEARVVLARDGSG